MTSEDEFDDRSVAEMLESDDSPFTKCPDCGKYSAIKYSHDCSLPDGWTLGQLRKEQRIILQQYDDRPKDEMVAHSPTSNSETYHRTQQREDGPRVVPDCANCLQRDREFRYDTRGEVQDRYARRPCAVCHDLPMDEIYNDLTDDD